MDKDSVLLRRSRASLSRSRKSNYERFPFLSLSRSTERDIQLDKALEDFDRALAIQPNQAELLFERDELRKKLSVIHL